MMQPDHVMRDLKQKMIDDVCIAAQQILQLVDTREDAIVLAQSALLSLAHGTASCGLTRAQSTPANLQEKAIEALLATAISLSAGKSSSTAERLLVLETVKTTLRCLTEIPAVAEATV